MQTFGQLIRNFEEIGKELPKLVANQLRSLYQLANVL
jgi:hypothetical protein